MASTLTDDAIKDLRKTAKAAKPYTVEYLLSRNIDAPEPTGEERKRVDATLAIFALENAGVPLEDE